MGFKKSQEDKLSYMRYNAKSRRIINQGKICDFVALNFVPRNHCRKVAKNLYQKVKYLKNEVGEYIPAYSEEVFEMKNDPDKKRNERSLRVIFREMQYLINSNFRNSERDQSNQLFITLTYKENMQDDKQLHNDFRNFWKRLKQHVKKHELMYISIIEPQARGAWHVHLLLKSLNHDVLYIPHEDIERLWGHGMTRTERLDCNNIGSYFVAYVSNAEVSEDRIKALEIPESDIKIKDGKKYVKGARIDFYKDYMQIYRHSKNVTYPEKLKATDRAVEVMEDRFPEITYQHIKEVETDRKTLQIGREQRIEQISTAQGTHINKPIGRKPRD